MYAYFLKKFLIGFTVCVIIFKQNFHLYISMHMGFFFLHSFKVTKLNDPATAKFKI